MSGEVKQRKKNSHVNSDGNHRDTGDKSSKSSSKVDLKSSFCLVLLVVCGALSWMVLQHSRRFSQMEEEFRSLQRRSSSLMELKEEMMEVSQKLVASEDDLQEALRAVAMATKLQQEVSALHASAAAMKTDENLASNELQAVNTHFMNVTETWQERLASINSDLSALKAESREGHASATEQVNEAERRARLLAERLEELEDSTSRNARALQRTEDDDAKKAQDQLDWNTKQIHKLDQEVGGLSRREAELHSQLQELVPRAQQCDEQLPQVEEAVRSILRLGGDLSGAEQRLEELTLQVLGSEDSMVKAVSEILEIRRDLEALQVHSSIQEMKSELHVVKEAVRGLAMVLKESRAEQEEEPWMEVPPPDDLTN
ncbi:inhibitor of nuclear factor kappa-B kinase-interacting protein isoform X1 [Gouania willdenowi]|uniref:Inhibitor of nuclear factor kappa-B kinase-interacting protein n=1 Tax=Gouania willdenowi TaxID=441366 RepID=A0A8C5DZN0_GOUWI|nr:inhibitor of nuclear factor kappa-B kinase-interacting protein isoform X1 [Gouania willdenowi]